MREIAETEGTRQVSSLNHRITYLADVGTIAPMVGLLGTVSGMIHSFGSLATDVATSKPMMLASGVSEALVCTASGLVVGIVAFTGYAYFRGRVQRLNSELEAAATQILAVFSLYYAPGTSSPARARTRGRAGRRLLTMNFRQKAAPPPVLGFQVTPMIDVFCCLLIFFIVTYNFSRAETSLEVKVPTAKEGKDNQRPINQCIINVASDGHVILNSQTLTQPSNWRPNCGSFPRFTPIRP